MRFNLCLGLRGCARVLSNLRDHVISYLFCVVVISQWAFGDKCVFKKTIIVHYPTHRPDTRGEIQQSRLSP